LALFLQVSFFVTHELKRGVLPICTILLCGIASCENSASRQEKALRVQLSRALRHHSYESALPLARRLIEAAPQDNSAWKQLVQAQLGLRDLDGAKQTLAQWRKAVRSPSPRLDKFEGDIAKEEHDTARALQSWEKALNRQPKSRRTLEKIALLEQSQRHRAGQSRRLPSPATPMEYCLGRFTSRTRTRS
jgi:tetratricopeptide (TPR) repeat protein